MAIVQISQIQLRRGLQQDLPQLASAEMGWSLDTRRLFIGNGTLLEGAPTQGVTEVLTEHSDFISFYQSYIFKNLASGAQVVTGINTLNPIRRTLQDKLDDIVSVKDFGAVGDGIADDTAAIQRALTNTFAANETNNPALLRHHRTIYFPAGQYNITATINIPPYSRLQGEGKRTTIISGHFVGPLAQFADSNYQSGIAFGYNGADTAEYHLSDMSFTQNNTTYNQSCIVIDGCETATFTRVLFSGLLSDTTGSYSGSQSSTNPVYDIARVDGTYGGAPAGVKMTNASDYSAVKNVVFNQCDFYQLCHGMELNQDCHGITISDCFFDRMYHYIVLGNNSPDPANYAPYDISLANNFFLHCAREGILCYPFVTQVMSSSNSYLAYGIADYQGDNPTVNPNGIAQYSAISFNANNNFSIGDSFNSGQTGAATATNGNLITVNSTSTISSGLPIKFTGTSFGGIQSENQYYVNTVGSNWISITNKSGGANIALSTASGTMQWQTGNIALGVDYVNNNGYIGYQVMQDIGIVDGRKTIGRARTTTLANAASFTSANLCYIPSDYTNLTMEYTLNHSSTQRTGTFKVSRVASNYIYDEEYNESGALGTSSVTFQANATTGDIEYISNASGTAAILTYSLNHYKA